MRVLVTGGAGYVGSHVAVELLAAGHAVTLLDDLSNAPPAAVPAIRAVAGRDVAFARGDVGDAALLDELFAGGDIDAVVHCAALKAVAESAAQPLRYYAANVAGSLRLFERMAAHGVKTVVFSSSAAVYGEPRRSPVTEDCPTAPSSPYGRTKLVVENLLRDIHAADPDWRVSILRYFNPAGAHPCGDLGEHPNAGAGTLMALLGQVAAGRRPRLDVFGDDYPTPDGTGVRDYLHVVDLARGHLRALEHLAGAPRLAIHNLGTGRGYSVLEVVRAFEAVIGRAIPYRIAGRRPRDIAASYADPARAERELGWTAEHGLPRMCEDLWRWQRRHPNGYGG